jgi:hypothetical protein
VEFPLEVSHSPSRRATCTPFPCRTSRKDKSRRGCKFPHARAERIDSEGHAPACRGQRKNPY